MKNELKILVGGLVLISLLSIGSFLAFPGLWGAYFVNSSGVLLTNAQILATVFAITISLTLLGFEYFSQNLSPKIARSIAKSNYIIGLVVVFIPSIIANVALVVVFGDTLPQIILTLSLLLLSICLVYLVSFIAHIVSTIQPQSQLRIFEKIIPGDYHNTIVQKMEKNTISGADPDDYFVDLLYLIQNKIKHREIYHYGEWLIFFADKEIEYLLKINEEKEDQEVNPEGAGHIVRYFLSFKKSIYSQLMGIDDSRFIPPYSRQIVNVLALLVELKAIAAFSNLSEHYKQIGQDIIKYNQESIYRQYFDDLEKLTSKTLNSIPATDYQVSAFELPDQTDERSESEIMWTKGIMGLFNNLVAYSRELSLLAIDANFEGAAISASNTYVELLEKALEREKGDQTRVDLAKSITRAQKSVFEYAAKNGASPSYYTLPSSYQLIVQSPSELQGFLVGEFCKAAKTAVEYDSFAGTQELGIAGRVFVKDHPEVTMEIVDTLIECLDIAINNPDLENVRKQTVVKELSSIKGWEDHSQTCINEKIEDALNTRNIKLNQIP